MFAGKSLYFRLSSSKMMFTKLFLFHCPSMPTSRFLLDFFIISSVFIWHVIDKTASLYCIYNFLHRHMCSFHSLSEAHSEQLTIFTKHCNLNIWRDSEYTSDLVNIGGKLNVHKTFKRRPGRPLNVLCTFNLRPVSIGEISEEGKYGKL